MPDYHLPLFPGGQYHVLSRAVGSEKLFRETKNYQFLLSKFDKHVSPVADTFCYSLLPNHFHFLVKIKEEQSIIKHFEEIKKNKAYSREKAPDFIMERFSNWLNSYTKSFNKAYNRKGSLFIDYLKRVEINSQEQLSTTIFYIHKNPVHHGYCRKISQWPWSSYGEILSDKSTKLLRKEVLECFGGKEGFYEYHNREISPRSQSFSDIPMHIRFK